ncbi:MAG: hypothetical protein J6A61_03795 [Clostridia bacterium]|nr:hypothetical protein [Clostridia bacterium]
MYGDVHPAKKIAKQTAHSKLTIRQFFMISHRAFSLSKYCKREKQAIKSIDCTILASPERSIAGIATAEKAKTP